jgi:hypothetical protein
MLVHLTDIIVALALSTRDAIAGLNLTTAKVKATIRQNRIAYREGFFREEQSLGFVGVSLKMQILQTISAAVDVPGNVAMPVARPELSS